MGHGDAGCPVEHLAQKVRGRAGTIGRETDIVRVGLGPADELGQGIHRQAAVDHHGQLETGGVDDRCEVVDRVVAQVLVEVGEHGHHARRAEQQGVAIGFRILHHVHRDATGRAAPVVEDDRAQTAAQMVGDGARQHVLRAAGRHADQHPDRFGGEVLAVAGSASRAEGRDTQTLDEAAALQTRVHGGVLRGSASRPTWC